MSEVAAAPDAPEICAVRKAHGASSPPGADAEAAAEAAAFAADAPEAAKRTAAGPCAADSGLTLGDAPSATAGGAGGSDEGSEPWAIDPAADLVLSDVHVGAAPPLVQRCTTVFRARRPPPQHARGAGHSRDRTSERSPECSTGHSPKHSPERGTERDAATPLLDKDGDVVVRRRQRTPSGGAAFGGDGGSSAIHVSNGLAAAETCARDIVIQHALATSLKDVGKQVQLLAVAHLPTRRSLAPRGCFRGACRAACEHGKRCNILNLGEGSACNHSAF